MRLGQPDNKKSTMVVRGIYGALALFFIIAFRNELWDVLSIFWNFFKMFVLRFPFSEASATASKSFVIISYNLVFGFGLVFLLWLVLISAQALLPVNSLQDVYRTAWHLWLYIIGRHGQAVFIKDGVKISTKEDDQRRGHGVIVVDFNSAIVLEDRELPPGCSRLVGNLGLSLLTVIGLTDEPATSRVVGPGIVFTHPDETVRGVVDLRSQFRLQPKVTCYTREGIELYSNINAIFSIGVDPEPHALQITYVGEVRPENLRICVFEAIPGRGGHFLRLRNLTNDLDAVDQAEIDGIAKGLNISRDFNAFTPLPRPSFVPVYNPRRVFDAVFAQARNNDQEVLPWTELPTRVASGFYREILPTINYDQLYDIKGNGEFPLPDFQRQVRINMRNNGILAYRLVFNATGEQLVEGRVYHESELIVSEIQQLTNSKLLRDRGIMMISSNFGDLFPVSPIIYKQRLDSWRARWERELNITSGSREMQAMRVRGRALANAQHDLWNSLNQLFSYHEFTDEALALQVMHELETAAADPKTRQLLPANTLEVMRYVNSMIQPVATSPKITALPGGGD